MIPNNPMTCGGHDPYNSATTDARWFFALAAREAQRRADFRRLFAAIKAHPEAFVRTVRDALARLFH